MRAAANPFAASAASAAAAAAASAAAEVAVGASAAAEAAAAAAGELEPISHGLDSRGSDGGGPGVAAAVTTSASLNETRSVASAVASATPWPIAGVGTTPFSAPFDVPCGSSAVDGSPSLDKDAARAAATPDGDESAAAMSAVVDSIAKIDALIASGALRGLSDDTGGTSEGGVGAAVDVAIAAARGTEGLESLAPLSPPLSSPPPQSAAVAAAASPRMTRKPPPLHVPNSPLVGAFQPQPLPRAPLPLFGGGSSDEGDDDAGCGPAPVAAFSEGGGVLVTPDVPPEGSSEEVSSALRAILGAGGSGENGLESSDGGSEGDSDGSGLSI